MTTRFRGLRAAASAGALAVFVAAGPAAAAPPPTDDLAVAHAALSDAVSAGGAELSPIALRNAQDKLDRASAALAAGDSRDARRLAREAEADARLAAATARAAKAERAVAEVDAGIRALREETARNGVR